MIRYTGRRILILLVAGMLALPPVVPAQDHSGVRQCLVAWARGFIAGDAGAVLAQYDTAFGESGRNLAAVDGTVTALVALAGNISLDIYEPVVRFTEDRASIEFVQLRHTPSFSDIGSKKITMIRAPGGWKITAERFDNLVGYVRLHPDQKFDLKRENLSDTTNGPPPTGSPPPRTPSSGSLEVRSIKFQIVNPWLESICLEADAPFTPVIFGLDDGKPRIVMDVSGTAPLTLPAVIPRDGLIVGSIRAHHDPAQNRLRIVLDLNSSGNIAVEPVFFEDLNTCCLGLRNRAMTPSTKGDLPRPSIEIKKP